MTPIQKEQKNKLEKRLKIVVARLKKNKSEIYDLKCAIFALKERCFACEQASGEVGKCEGCFTSCLHPDPKAIAELWRPPVVRQ